MPLTEAGMNHILNTYFATYTFEVSLHTGVPDQLNEVTGNGYTRQVTDFGLAENGHVENTEHVTYMNMPAVTVTHAALRLTDNTILAWAALIDGPFTVTAGQALRIAKSDLDITLV